MRLLRDGVPVRPIHPGRICESVTLQGGYNRLQDVGCYGQYLYDPAEFVTSSRYQIQVFSEDDPETPQVKDVSEVLVMRIRSDFAPFFAATVETPDPLVAEER